MSRHQPESVCRKQEVFLQAADIENVQERDALLDRACGDDAELRDSVDALLRHHRQDSFLEQPALAVDAERTAVAAPVTEKPGDSIGRYKLREIVGEGGCGVVYVADQEEPVRRRVALKIIKPGMDTQSVIARFEAERQALAMMDHPNIARVLDAGTTETGRPYFVMELVRGIRITDYCALHVLSTDARLDLFTKVCHAVQHAHQKGIIHRDLKPSNVLVTLHDGVPVPKVIDFGIAKATEGRLTDRTIYTELHQFIGTPAYMSPEQAEMSGLDIDTRSDIYSLGVLLYELLTGTTPFDAQDLLRAGFDEMRRIIRETEPPKPSTRLTHFHRHGVPASAGSADPREGGTPSVRAHKPPIGGTPSLPSDLDWIVMKCLEKDRARRYETANGLGADIQRHLSNEPVVARPPSVAYRFERMVRRNRLAFAAGTAVAVALTIGLTGSLWQAVEKSRALVRVQAAEQAQSRSRQQAEASEKLAKIEAVKSEQVARFLTDILKGVGPRAALGRDTTLLREILEETAKRISEDLSDQPEVEVKLRNIIGLVYEQIEEHPAAEAMATNALALRLKLNGGEHPEVARSLYLMGMQLNHRGEYALAEAMHLEALAMRRRLLGEKHYDVLVSLNNVGMTLHNRGDLDGAEARYREALETARKLPGQPVAMSLGNLATVLDEKGDHAGAETVQREQLGILREEVGNDHPKLAGSLNVLGAALLGQGRMEEAEGLFREALAMYRKFWGEGHPAQLGTLTNLGMALESLGDLAGAESAFRQAIALRPRQSDKAPPGALCGLATVLFKREQWIEAERVRRECLEVCRALPSHKRTARVINNLGVALHGQSRWAEAEGMYREALAMLDRVPNAGPNDRDVPVSNLLFVLFRQGKLAEAEEVISADLRTATDPKEVRRLLEQRGDLRARRGRWTDAAADLARAVELNPDNHLRQHKLAALLAQIGNLDDYRAHCGQEAELFRDTTDAHVAERMAKDGLILPDSGVDRELLTSWTDLAVSAGKESEDLSWFQSTKSLAAYRCGRFAEAVEGAGRTLEVNNSEPELAVQATAVLAMARHRLGETKDARTALADASKIEAGLPNLESGDIGENWLDWIIAHKLLSEARGLIGRDAVAAGSSGAVQPDPQEAPP